MSIIAAAGIVLLRQSTHIAPLEVLLLKRNAALKVHGGEWVFPGGKVDPEDYQTLNRRPSAINLSQPPALSIQDHQKLLKQTALRETHEEAGVLLKDNALSFYSRWRTPSAIKKRFDTCFFMAINNKSEVTVDGNEIVEHAWVSPSRSLVLLKNGTIKVPPATYVSLLQLSRFEHAQTAINTLCKKPVYYRPKLISTGEGICSLYEEDAGYPDENYFAEGTRHRLIIKPGSYDYINSC